MKKQILVAGAALMALAVPVIAAQHDGGSHAMKPDMTRAEVEAKVKERFTMIDANKDGAITVEEVKAHKEARHKQRADAHFKMMDGNGDGSISRAEFDAGHAAMRDGMMTGGKGDRGHGPMMGGGHHGMAMKMGERMFEKADANKDGRVTLAEASSAALAHFDKADADKNGTVTSQERMNYWKSQKGDWKDDKAAS